MDPVLFHPLKRKVQYKGKKIKESIFKYKYKLFAYHFSNCKKTKGHQHHHHLHHEGQGGNKVRPQPKQEEDKDTVPLVAKIQINFHIFEILLRKGITFHHHQFRNHLQRKVIPNIMVQHPPYTQ